MSNKSIKFNAKESTISYDSESNLLNIAFKLPDNTILSINKVLENNDTELVGFNLMNNRELLISSVMNIKQLIEFISKTQEEWKK